MATLALPGPEARFDYESIDPTSHTLYISHLGADQLLVFDLRRRRVVDSIAAPGVHGVLAVPQLGRVFASATNAREVLTIDARTNTVTARAAAGLYPDGIAYDAADRRIFVSDEQGGVETVLDRAGRRIATIALGGEAGNVQYDSGSDRILVDDQTHNELVAIDPGTDHVVSRLQLHGCEEAHGLLVDASRRLAFIACAGNATLLTLDLRRMRISGRSSVGDNPDVLALDSTLHRLYVAAESGVVAVFTESAHGLSKLGQAFVATEAHSVAVDQRTHLVYFPLEQSASGRPELLVMSP